MNKTLRILIVLAFITLMASACTLFGAGTEPEAAPPSEEGAPSQEEAVGAAEEEPPAEAEEAAPPAAETLSEESAPQTGTAPALIDLDDPALFLYPEGIQTYRTTLDYRFEAPGPITGTIDLESATRVEPYETTLEFTTDGHAVMGNQEVFTFTQIAGIQYVVYTGFGCISGAPGSQENPFDVMLDTGGMLTGQAQYLGEENINELSAYAYAITMENINVADPAGSGVESIQGGKVYIAQDGGFILRLSLEGSGQNEALSGDPALTGNIYYELNYLDFDQPVDIQIPGGCAAADQAELPYPIPEDATNLSNLSGLIGFETGMATDAVVEFYKTEMSALGCGDPQVTGADPALTLAFSCPSGMVQVFLGASDSGGSTVTILSTP